MAATNEFSRRIHLEPWPEGRLSVAFEAAPAELQALARRLDLLELRALAGTGLLQRSPDGREVSFDGRLEAEVVQTCVVTLEPVASVVSAPIERRFALVDDRPGMVAELEFSPDPDEVELEPLLGDTIDLGEVIAEELSLALEPYPRIEDPYALLPDLGPHVTIGPESGRESPFAVLQEQSERRAR